MIFEKLKNIWKDVNYPFFQDLNNKELYFNQIESILIDGIEKINSGDVIALIGDFNPNSIATLIKLLEKGAIVVPLTKETKEQHEYFLRESLAQYIFEENKLIKSLSQSQIKHQLLDNLRHKKHPGLILFTTGTTGKPKAILHDFIPFIERYKTPRPPLKALSFLLFDHIGGLNTLFHMLFNQGQVVSIKERTLDNVINAINKYSIELLPTTPTFLRMMSFYHNIEKQISDSLKIISYGTERMDQPTLDRLCKQFPTIDFRQTYGMSELGILRIKSKARDSLFMKVGGEGVETKIVDSILYIKAKNRMLGYLNSSSPFNSNNWYCTKDIVELSDDNYIRITGRDSDAINVGGLKFMPSEIEIECLKNQEVKYAKAIGKENPITGEHVELYIESRKNNNHKQLKESIMAHLKEVLPKHMLPSRIKFQTAKVSHRFKKL